MKKVLKRYSCVVTLVLLVLALSMVTVQGQTADYPVVVTTADGVVYVGTHSSNAYDGNWVKLTEGTPVSLPDLSLSYVGITMAHTDSIAIKSTFGDGGADYPSYPHMVYADGQDIGATFYGQSKLFDQFDTVDFVLVKISSIAEAKQIASTLYNGDITDLKSKLNADSWRGTLNAAGDAEVTIDGQDAGSYLLLVVNRDGTDIYLHSATIVLVVERTLSVSAPSSVERGRNINLDTGGGGYSVAVLIKKSAYSGEVKLTSAGSVLSTKIHLNTVELASGALAAEELSLGTAFDLLEDVMNAIGSNQMDYGIGLGSSVSISTNGLASRVKCPSPTVGV